MKRKLQTSNHYSRDRLYAGLYRFALLLFSLSFFPAWADEITFLRDEITIESRSGSQHFTVEIAKTPQQSARGLMYRTRLEADAGMLFIHDNDKKVAMWMKNTLIPLDMLFIDKNGKIVYIAPSTTPGSLKAISPGDRAVRAVLELKAETASARGIDVGDRVIYKVFEQ